MGIERLQRIGVYSRKYTKRTLEIDKFTPGYLVRAEIKREKVEVKAITRAMKFEDKLRFWRWPDWKEND